MFLSGLVLTIIGVSRSPIALSLSLFGIMLFPPFIHAPLTALIQRTVPADLQGRTFALTGVFAQLLTPIAYAFVGPLVDHVLEPAVSQPNWAYVAPLVGNTAGAGMALLMVVGGSLVMILTLLFATFPSIRALEGATS